VAHAGFEGKIHPVLKVLKILNSSRMVYNGYLFLSTFKL